MARSPGVLTVLADPVLRNEIERIGAAIGVRVVHAEAVPDRRAWSAAAAVILDETAVVGCAHVTSVPFPRRAHVLVVAGAEVPNTTWSAAISLGAQQVLTAPLDEAVLAGALAEAAETVGDDRRDGRVAAVIGGCGGAGASLFSAALAQTASTAMLVDLDPWSGGLDLLMADDLHDQICWPELHLEGGRLAWSTVREALPTRCGAVVLSSARYSHELNAGAVEAVLDAGRRGGATVICDLPRRLTDAAETALGAADLVTVITRCDVRAAAATAALLPVLAARNPNVGLVVRGPAPGGLRATQIAEITAVPVLAAMRAEPRLVGRVEYGRLRLRRNARIAAAARRVLAMLETAGPGGRVE
ncbi:hypothetical protein H7J77_03280 [Mycolicibacillus parakoreensis]|uniref:septum site-determining protein Ssd n=1 Tax=Mycolicibacillus parakoreensis TaxID=1069221 RepID=UPI0023E1A9FC|nr:septum site-determining protein Ssd [Mycolicibacillus parakoreensis]MCV7314572.1 hypothetical protein [Mycolicibacillus parakoreensis]HLR99941.1 septum site-determining protein Ssd [Mycolicibacillus parakoreensis]